MRFGIGAHNRLTIGLLRARRSRLSTSWFGALALCAALAAPSASAYTVEGGNILMKPVLGASLNVLRLEVASRSTPPGGLLMGFDLDYSFDGPINLTGAFRPVFSLGFVEAQVGAGLKYRVTQLQIPIIPYASGMIVGTVGGPLRYGAPHVNAGLRVAGGVDYFVMRNISFGVEAAVDTSVLAYPILMIEASAEVLAGVTWRLDVL